jgi:polyisoprenoid-binding protein YceI
VPMTTLILSFVSSVLLATPSFAKPDHCTYRSKDRGVAVSFVGYKTTNKVGVEGKFLNVTTEGQKARSKHTLAKLLALPVTVDLMSVDSGNPVRDQNLKTAFFGLMSSQKAVGRLTNLKMADTGATGTANLELTLNGVTKEFPVILTRNQDSVYGSVTIDTLAFGANKAFDALSKVCHDLHKGEDGVSKTWSEVEVKISHSFQKNCQDTNPMTQGQR